MKIRHESKTLNRDAKEEKRKFYITRDNIQLAYYEESRLWSRAMRLLVRNGFFGTKVVSMPQRKRRRLCSFRNVRNNFLHKHWEMKMKTENLRSAKDQAKYEETQEQRRGMGYGCLPLLIVWLLSWVVFALGVVALIWLVNFLWGLL